MKAQQATLGSLIAQLGEVKALTVGYRTDLGEAVARAQELARSAHEREQGHRARLIQCGRALEALTADGRVMQGELATPITQVLLMLRTVLEIPDSEAIGPLSDSLYEATSVSSQTADPRRFGHSDDGPGADEQERARRRVEQMRRLRRALMVIRDGTSPNDLVTGEYWMGYARGVLEWDAGEEQGT